ncbi:hypothetical protein IV203_030580 [Nitzschia inconspicua]|uniref:Uncharacterized protein n=1 Tax=Nitzschia inconspicua TaxID=303405 RepID=A0A9K3KBZ9_9STRA|nr:hypothetical protein IV203_022905 [Nitzschia inconspicua]KAG7367837.1 hypothetical protein IV203_030580 [Nitzschia inconspicua]
MESTDWYSSCLDDDWYGSNLDLTAEYLRCHMESDLYEKVNEEYTEQRNVLLSGHSKGTDPEEVLTLAQGHYQDLCVQVNFIATTCGGPHLLRHCPKPRDKCRIRKNRKRFEEIRTLAEDDSSSDDSSTDSTDDDTSTDDSKT